MPFKQRLGLALARSALRLYAEPRVSGCLFSAAVNSWAAICVISTSNGPRFVSAARIRIVAPVELSGP